jgi:hypothetical protein
LNCEHGICWIGTKPQPIGDFCGKKPQAMAKLL